MANTIRASAPPNQRKANATRIPGGFSEEESDSGPEPHPPEPDFEGHLSPLPTGDTSMADNESSGLTVMNDTVNEAEMHRRLMEMESSFLPQPSPANGSADNSAVMAQPKADETSMLSESSFSPIPYKTPLPEDNGTVSTMGMSSPAAAAAARTVSRVTSIATMGGYVTADDGYGSVRSSYAEADDEDSDSASRATEQELTPRKYIHRRNASQRSTSSQHSTAKQSSTASDATLGADYALQSGGAVPQDGVNALPEGQLSRSGSLGSLLSGDVGEMRNGEHDQSTDVFSDPATPKSRDLRAPSDTVVAQHVRNIQVPPSVARQFRFQQEERSPTKTKKGLTLKEQSSTIDRMVKENFDLKIKIHYLDDALNKRSEEGVKEMISENVELRAKLASLQKEIRNLKRKIRDFEKAMESERSKRSEGGSEIEPSEEIYYLRERIEHYELEIEQMRTDGAAREAEKRSMAEVIQTLSERGGNGAHEEANMWKGLLEAETARREMADDTNRKLREEIRRLQQMPPSYSSDDNFEQLRSENDELRREVSAQTSMLTSRNREKERLYQEIEGLKLGLMRDGAGRSVAGDSILDRSASRAGDRAYSDTSDALVELRSVKLELEKQLESCLDELEQGDAARADLERMVRNYEEEIEAFTTDLQTLQEERDEALQMHEESQTAFEELKGEAQQELQLLEDELQEKIDQLSKVQGEFSSKDENFEALQAEMRAMSEGVVRLEDDQKAKINMLQQKVQDSAQRVRTLEKNLSEAHEKNEMLSVQQESFTGEIAFLREDQETDKMRIGELQAALKTAQLNLQAEKELVTALEQRHADERAQREAVGNQERQRLMEELNREVFNAREEVRWAKKSVSTREVEAKEWRDKLGELEKALRDALGLESQAGIVKSVAKMRLDYESSMLEVRSLRNTIHEKDSLQQDRDQLLERNGLQVRQLSEMLEKERQARRSDRVHLENMQREAQNNNRSVAAHQTQISELQNMRSADKKRLAVVEAQYREQLAERNGLLLTLWNRLSTVCGKDWTQKNGLVNNRTINQETIATQLPDFSGCLVKAMKTIEGLVLNFKARIRQTERDLWKEYQALEHTLDQRSKQITKLESALQKARGEWVSQEIAKLRSNGQPQRPESVSAAAASTAVAKQAASDGGVLSASHDRKWLMKLRELERKLKTEREERLLDRTGARKRLQEGKDENDQLRAELQRERERQAR